MHDQNSLIEVSKNKWNSLYYYNMTFFTSIGEIFDVAGKTIVTGANVIYNAMAEALKYLRELYRLFKKSNPTVTSMIKILVSWLVPSPIIRLIMTLIEYPC